MAILSYANSAGTYAFAAASNYVFRPDASTSTSPPPSSPSSSSSPSSTASSSHSSPNPTSTSTSTQIQSKPKHRRTTSSLPHPSPPLPSSSSSSSSPLSPLPPSSGTALPSRTEEQIKGEQLCTEINQEEDLYVILGLVPSGVTNGNGNANGWFSGGTKNGSANANGNGNGSTRKRSQIKSEEIRRAFLGRSRVIHPDKLPHYPPATPAFQRLSYAYETLSKPASRRMYDLGGGRGYDPGSARDPASAGMADETLNGVLRNVFTEFLAGDFEMIRVFVNALNEGNPGLNLGDEAVDNLEGAFKRVREVLLTGQKYLRLIKFELIRLYEIQHSLRSLGYLDFVGRLRLTLALTRVTLEIPMVLDRAMREEPASAPRSGMNGNGHANGHTNGNGDIMEEDEEGGMNMSNGNGMKGTGGAGELQRRGLLGPRVKGVLVIACKVLEKGEKFGL